ncbi:MAG: VCBS repeat-containing protein [Planctomycetes bacterium]|nr:VCBS repeat-containing protein [Planctomycetota bacterium]
MRNRSLLRTAAALALVPALLLAGGLVASRALALINPNFTPVHVEKSSTHILALKPKCAKPGANAATLEIAETIKGKAPGASLSIDFNKVAGEKDGKQAADELLTLLAESEKKGEAVFLAIGEMEGKRAALLHVSGQWARLTPGTDETAWQFEKLDPMLRSTFNGSTDMLLETMRYMRKFPDMPIMPATGGVNWDSQNKLESLRGKAGAVIPVDVNGDGLLDLFAACAEGDILWVQKDTTFAPLEKWNSKCISAAWADFNADGHPDCALLGADGSLRLRLQDASGKFSDLDVKPAGSLANARSVQAVGLAPGAPSSLVIGGNGAPVVLRNKGTQPPAFETLPLGTIDSKDWGPSGPVVVADFDNDGRPDLLHCFQKNGAHYCGEDGGFAAPVACSAAMGEAKERSVTLADFDGDGRLDLYLSGGGSLPVLLQNREGGFSDVSRFCGEPSYNLQPGATCIAAGDFNNDTFADLFVGYGEDAGQFYYNRGFRSFAINEALKFHDDDMPGQGKGQSAAAWADFDSDGALDLACVLANGDVYLAKTTLGTMMTPACLHVKLPPDARSCGTLNIRLAIEGRCIGAARATAHGPAAFFGIPQAGEYEVRWQLPGQPEVSKKVIVENAPVEIVVGPSPKAGQ